MLRKEQNIEVSDTTKLKSCSIACAKKLVFIKVDARINRYG